MIGKKKVLAIIPARGGSKGVPRKNLRRVGDRSLLARAIDGAKSSQFIDKIVVSTDDSEIADEAKKCGADVPFFRPAEISSDTAGSVDVVLHALSKLENYDLVVLLQPTSPFRVAGDIDACLRLVDQGAEACISVSEPAAHPQWMFQIGEKGNLVPLLSGPRAARRQDLPTVYVPNGMVYVISVNTISDRKAFITENTAGYVVEQAWRVLDIDTEEDLELADYWSSKFEA